MRDVAHGRAEREAIDRGGGEPRRLDLEQSQLKDATDYDGLL
jgi:hypothetical protein